MDFKALKWLLLFAVAMMQVGCATDAPDPTSDLEPATSTHDDSHGWGANMQAGGR